MLTAAIFLSYNHVLKQNTTPIHTAIQICIFSFKEWNHYGADNPQKTVKIQLPIVFTVYIQVIRTVWWLKYFNTFL